MLTPREKSPLPEKFSQEKCRTHDAASSRTTSEQLWPPKINVIKGVKICAIFFPSAFPVPKLSDRNVNKAYFRCLLKHFMVLSLETIVKKSQFLFCYVQDGDFSLHS